jgi:hypothetical protein
MSHWYDKDGKATHKVPYADPSKGMRDTTLRDAKKLELVPSVTTVLNVLNKPALTRWKLNQMLEACLGLEREQDESEQAFIRRVWKASEQKATDAANMGTAIHDAIESFILGESFDLTYEKHAVAVDKQLFQLGVGDVKLEHSFVHSDGYGGMIDLHNDEWVIDHKSKEFDETWKPMAYPEQCMQLVAYDEGLGNSGRRLGNMFVSRTVPGLVRFWEWDDKSFNSRQLRTFKNALDIWQIQNDHMVRA